MQLSFDTTPRARATDPVTSHEAADRAGSLAADHARRILAWLKAHPAGGIKDEIATGTNLSDVQVARRLPEMEEAGFVRRTDETRETKRGRKATVWAVA